MSRKIVVALLWAGVAAAQKKPVTLESVSRAPAEGFRGGGVVWAPDGKRFAYFERKAIWLYDVPSRTKKEVASTELLEKAAVKAPAPPAHSWQNRRVSEERLQWSGSGADLLLSVEGDVFLWHLDSGKWDQLTATPVAERDPRLSPDGKRVAFRREHDLYVLDVAAKAVTRLTHDGSPTLLNAELDWVYPEELDLGRAHWWSPDSKRVAYLQFDISHEMVYPHADLLAQRPLFEPQRYPYAGTPNPDVRLLVVEADGTEAGKTQTRMSVPPEALVARVDWLPGTDALAVQRLNRVQNQLDLIRVEAGSGATTRVLRETSPHWINVTDDFRPFHNGERFLWSSERDGFRHLYLYSMKGEQIAQITRGEWEVTGVAGVDEAGGRVYYLSTEASPLERQLYSVTLNGDDKRRLTSSAGSHSVSMSPTCEYYMDTASSLTSPPRRALHKSDGSEWAVYREADRKQLEEYEILPTEIVHVKAPDGALLYARLIKPARFEAGRKYPAIVMVYGGPHAQSVRNAWAGANWDQALAHRGFVIWQLDNRGSSGRGAAWEATLYRRLGKRELEDQKIGVQHLVSMGFVDAARIGIHGWSYGGYMTLYSLLNAPEVFRAGVAGAPVTDWHNYDTIYTERYLGLPSENEEGYKASSPLNSAGNLKARLMLVHNIDDDNVLFRNTLQMADALEKAKKPFEMMIYPQKSHGVSGQARSHMLQVISEFFERNLAQ